MIRRRCIPLFLKCRRSNTHESKSIEEVHRQAGKGSAQPGEVFECTPERYDEIMSKNRLIEPVEKDEPEKESVEQEAEPVKTEEPAPVQKDTGTQKPEKAKRTTKKK